MAGNMTTRWMDRMHALVPMTEQEEQVDDILNQYAIDHRQHVVFPVEGRTYVVDFYLTGTNSIIECWKSSSRRGIALTWIEKNAAYVDWKFRRIKGVYPNVKSIALVEVDQAEPSMVRKYAGAVLEHADSLCCSMDELAAVCRRIAGVR